MPLIDLFRYLSRDTRPATLTGRRPARVTTPAERAPLYAAYAAARAYGRRTGNRYDDGIIKAAVEAYEHAKTGGTSTTLRSGLIPPYWAEPVGGGWLSERQSGVDIRLNRETANLIENFLRDTCRAVGESSSRLNYLRVALSDAIDRADHLRSADPKPTPSPLMRCGHPVDFDDDDLGCRGCHPGGKP